MGSTDAGTRRLLGSVWGPDSNGPTVPSTCRALSTPLQAAWRQEHGTANGGRVGGVGGGLPRASPDSA